MTTVTATLKVHVLKQFISENPVAKFLLSHTAPIKKFYAHNSDLKKNKIQQGKRKQTNKKTQIVKQKEPNVRI